MIIWVSGLVVRVKIGVLNGRDVVRSFVGAHDIVSNAHFCEMSSWQGFPTYLSKRLMCRVGIADVCIK
jgi:hypothetical protein